MTNHEQVSGAPIPDGLDPAPDWSVDLLAYASWVSHRFSNIYPDAATANQANPAPINGEIRYLASPGVAQQYRTVVNGNTINDWTPLFGGLRGITQPSGTSGAAGATPPTDYYSNGSIPNVTVWAGRKYRVHVSVFFSGGGHTGALITRFKVASTNTYFAARSFRYAPAPNDFMAIDYSTVYTAPTSGQETFILESNTSDSVVVPIDNGGGRDAVFEVEDLGWGL